MTKTAGSSLFSRSYEKIQTDQLRGKPLWNFKLLGIKYFSLIFLSLFTWEPNVMLGLLRHREHTHKIRVGCHSVSVTFGSWEGGQPPPPQSSLTCFMSLWTALLPLSPLLHKREFFFVLCMNYKVKIIWEMNNKQKAIFLLHINTHTLSCFFSLHTPFTSISHEYLIFTVCYRKIFSWGW